MFYFYLRNHFGLQEKTYLFRMEFGSRKINHKCQEDAESLLWERWSNDDWSDAICSRERCLFRIAWLWVSYWDGQIHPYYCFWMHVCLVISSNTAMRMFMRTYYFNLWRAFGWLAFMYVLNSDCIRHARGKKCLVSLCYKTCVRACSIAMVVLEWNITKGSLLFFSGLEEPKTSVARRKSMCGKCWTKVTSHLNMSTIYKFKCL